VLTRVQKLDDVVDAGGREAPVGTEGGTAIAAAKEVREDLLAAGRNLVDHTTPRKTAEE
jgi:hypothetical protein